MLVGYARVSTQEQTLALQQDALKTIGCEHIFTDTASGAKTDRPGLDQALRFVRAGDTLVVWRLDRLGRSLKHLIETISQLQERGIGFKSIQENIDTTTSGGKLIFHVCLERWLSLSGILFASEHRRGYSRHEHVGEKVDDRR